MEKISGARAMDWSIQLEKGLRSTDPSRRLMVIKDIGIKLQEWSTEPVMTKAVCDMYGLIPGHDRLFANTILLRLADAFRTGDNCMRMYILKAFLLELKLLRKKGRNYDGILAKQRVPNHTEMLKRVKIVFDTGDNEARSLALRLFGCWADFAKDSTHIRYIIVSSLRSSYNLEVKASLFAAGCFCLLSEDFACVVLEILIDILSSSQTSADIKLAAIHVLPKMRCSFFIQRRAYKAGQKLLSSPLEDELFVALLTALSALVLSSHLLSVEQVTLLQSFVCPETSSVVKLTALKSLYFLSVRGNCSLPAKGDMLAELFKILDDDILPLDFHYSTLKLLCKMCSMRGHSTFVEKSELSKLVKVVTSALQSSNKIKRRLGERLLVNMLRIKLNGAPGCSLISKCFSKCCQLEDCSQDMANASAVVDFTCLFCHFSILILNQVDTILKLSAVESSEEIPFSEVKKECHRLIRLIVYIVREHSPAGFRALDRTRRAIESLLSRYRRFNLEKANSTFEGSLSDTGPEHTVLEFILWMCKFETICLRILDEAGDVNDEIYCMVKPLVEGLAHSAVGSTFEVFCLSLHFYAISDYCNIPPKSLQKLHSYYTFGFSREWKALIFAKSIVKEKNYWEAYRAAKYACSEGLWFSAAFTFRKTSVVLQSESSRCWLKSLLLLAGSESEIKLLIFPNAGMLLSKEMQSENTSVNPFNYMEGDISQYIDRNYNVCEYKDKFMKVYNRICSSEEMLASSRGSDHTYYFQRWFLNLRSEVLKVLVDMLALLASNKFADNDLSQIYNLACNFASISLRFHKLAKGYDLLSTSFPGIDRQSIRSISWLAFHCSLMAFSSAFFFYFPSDPAHSDVSVNYLKELQKCSHALILRDFVLRLRSIDKESLVELQELSSRYGILVDNLCNTTKADKFSHIDEVSSLTCRFVISSVISSQQDLRLLQDDKDLQKGFIQGFSVLSDIILKWMQIPFQIPRFFFAVRSCCGAELYVSNGDLSKTNEISVSLGSELSLNLNVQLKNSMTDFNASKIEKMYCILAAKRSACSSVEVPEKEQTGWSLNPSKINEMVELNDILLKYIRFDITKVDHTFDEMSKESNMVTSFACFKLNSKGQGFSSSLLNVAEFPEGLYKLKWHCCCFTEEGSFQSLVPLNSAPIFKVRGP